jgi:hypothetical protein
MTDDSTRPIVVTGLGRSGTTWMQTLLSQHPRIHIHGQSPNIPWQTLWQWYETLIEQGQWSQSANRQTGYDIPHYAGSLPRQAHELFKQMFHGYFTGNGPETPRWGLKWLRLPYHAKSGSQFEVLWPETLWVVCIRDPFRTVESMKNTFVPDLDVAEWLTMWVRMCEFVTTHDDRRVTLLQLDRLATLDTEQRLGATRDLLHRLGESPTVETDAFTRRWPIIHKVKPDGARSFRLSDAQKNELFQSVRGLQEYAARLGYKS